MNNIRCPKCKIINLENARICRRCGAPLSREAEGHTTGIKSPTFGRTALKLTGLVIAIVSLLCIYGFYRHSQSVLSPGAGLAETNAATAKNAPASRELEELKKLNQDFLGRLDQNMSDRQGEGFKKNQTLAYDTMMALQEKQNKLTDAAALKYLDEFHRLVNLYYDQLVRFNSDKAHLVDANQRTSDEIEQIQQDPSLSDDDKFSRKRDLKGKLFDDSQKYSSSSNDIEETVKFLRNLLAAGAAT